MPAHCKAGEGIAHPILRTSLLNGNCSNGCEMTRISGELDPLYIAASSILLDALEASVPRCETVTLTPVSLLQRKIANNILPLVFITAHDHNFEIVDHVDDLEMS